MPKDNKESVCLKMESSFSFSVNYLASEKVRIKLNIFLFLFKKSKFLRIKPLIKQLIFHLNKLISRLLARV